MRNGIVSLVGMLAMAMTAIGCQSNPTTTSVRYDNVRFMDVWSTYTHCLSTSEIQAALLDANKLRQVSQAQPTQSPLNNLLPAKLRSMVSQPASRLAVDVRAMAASCGLHAGDVAMSAGESDLAMDQFRDVLQSHAGSDYSYYTAQARERLSQLELTLQAALR
ncbi:MAG: hypothetical protein JSR62_16350 [Nitrospira sp.]|nr:hypothetical protein [Nitrospira sp.]